MADTTLKLRVLLEAAGIKPTAAQLKKLNKDLQELATGSGKAAKGMSNVSNAANKTKRNLEGVAQRSNRAGKDFSRMAQGMGGLVQAYATVAANVFALSSAFLVLRRAADLSSMIKSAENFSDRFGVSVTRITKRMQEASGGALDFAEALPSINKAVSAGVGIEQMEQLTIAATKASQTFGGTTTEALNRFISASQRGRVEIIQTLGVVIKTEAAYKEYAARIGKTAQELTAFDRQQAILNATVEESKKVFDGIEIDPNPFTQFASTIVDLKDTILTSFTNFVTPIVSAFNKSKEAAAAFIAIISIAVAKRIFPEFTSLLSGLTAASISSTAAATQAYKKSIQIRQKSNEEFAKTSTKTSLRALTKQAMLEEESYAKRTKQHAAFKKSLFNQDGTINAQRLNQQKAFLRKQEEAILKGKGITQTLSTDLTEVRKQIDLRVRLGAATNAVNTSEKLLNQTQARSTTWWKKQAAALNQYSASLKSTIIGLRSGVITGFSKSFQTMQTNVILGIKKMSATWRVWYNSIGVTGINSVKRFSEAFGRTVGVVAGGITRLISAGTSLFLYWQLAQFAIEKFGDQFRGITKVQRAALDSFSNLGDSLQDITNRTENYLASNRAATTSLAGFIKQAEFLRGTFDSITVAVNDFNTAVNRLFLLQSSGSFIDVFKNLRLEIEATKTAIQNLGPSATTIDIGNPEQVGGAINFSKSNAEAVELTNRLSKLESNFKGIGAALDEIITESGPKLIENFVSTTKLLEETGLPGLSKELESQITTGFKAALGPLGDDLTELLEGKNYTELTAAMLSIQDTATRATAFKVLANALGVISPKALSIAGNFAASGKALEEVNRQMDVYLTGIDKARAANVPNKELFNILLNAQRALSDLIKSAPEGANDVNIANLPNAPDLETVRKFVNFEGGSAADFLGVITSELEVYNRVIEDSVTKQSRLAEVQNRTFALKNEEARSDARRIQLVRELNQAELDKIKIEQTSAELALEVAKVNARRLNDEKDASSLARQEANEQVKALELEIKGYKLASDAIKQRTNVEREIFKIRKEALDLEVDLNKNRLQTVRALTSITENDNKNLHLKEQAFNLEKEALVLQQRSIIEEFNRVQATEKNAQIRERNVIRLQQELELIEAQNLQLERQRLFLQAERAEQAGVSIFDPEGARITAQIFGRELQNQARNLKSTFEILGKGFANTLNTAVDNMIMNLLEGGKDFAENMREGLKASLREVFGEALSSRIKEGIAQAFNIDTEQQQVQARHNELLASQELLRIALIRNAEAVEGKKSIGQLGPTKEAAKALIPTGIDSVGKLDEIVSVLGGGIPVEAPTLANLLGVTNQTTEEGVKQSQESSKGIISTLLQLGSTLVSAIFSSGGAGSSGGILSSILGVFTAKNGGIASGGFKAFANGGYVTQPTLGLVGEGNRNEAVVPLPNNREIPVEMRGSTGDTINIEQNFDFRNADTSAIPRLRAEARAIEERTFARVFSEINRGGRYAKISGRR